ncbi:MAG: hypothetical protein FGM27_08025 [Candidatus Omnitrophica bacterium]|nr:hypothetical protein [Candidatus Omnitrophota bacterium]
MTPRVLQLADAAAFFAVYVFWGGTFLARAAAIRSADPLLMAGFQFTLAGLLMALYASWRRNPRPAARDIWAAALPGFLILSCGTGLLAWSQQSVPSGRAALLTASVPLWMVLLDHAFRKSRPSLREAAGLAAGFSGIAVLVPGEPGAGSAPALAGSLVLLLAAFLWSLGSLICRGWGAHLPSARWLSLQLLWGGFFLLAAAAGSGSWGRFNAAAIEPGSWAAFFYLVVLGGFAGFLAYDWLLRRAGAAAAASHAFVNPLIAVLLGVFFAGESLRPGAALAALLILLSVLLLLPSSAESRLDAGTGNGRIRV